MDAFALARKYWLDYKRIDIGEMAVELGVARATLFRWVGTRENLYGEVIASLFTRSLDRALALAKSPGLEQFFEVTERLLVTLVSSGPLRTFVTSDPEFALRVLTSKHSPVQHRCVQAFRLQIEKHTADGSMEPALPAEDLAYLLVRIVESFLYRDVITGAEPDMTAALQAIRILVTAKPDKKR
jgi:AcrR family transcriptional regulator